MNYRDKKIGVALGGGGSLGSYEMGVWTALRELKIEPMAISGTSIGALIGAFMTADKYEAANELWQDVEPSKVMKDGINLQWDDLVKTFKHDRDKILTFTKRYIENKGADITPFIELIKSKITAEEIKKGQPRFGVVAVSVPFLKQHNVELCRVPDEEVLEWLFASSAIWPLFPARTINGKTYIDGGYKDSLPIQFAFDLGADVVIAVNLFYRIAWHPLLNRKNEVINIEPSWNLGTTFNFDQAMIDRNRALGYNDALKRLGDKLGYRYTFNRYNGLEKLDKQLLDYIDDKFKLLKLGIIRLLKMHTKKRFKDNRLFLRGLEVLAETLKLDPTPIYEVERLAVQCYELLVPQIDTHDVVKILKKVRSSKQLTSNDEKTALEAIKYIIEHQYHSQAVTPWVTKKAKYALTYIMLTIIQQTFITKIEDKEARI